MTRVAFYVEPGSGWLGGVSYYRNLFAALAAAPELALRPVVIAGAGAPVDAALGDVDVLCTSAVTPRRAAWLARSAVRRVVGSDLVLDLVLAVRGVALLSHAHPLGPAARTPSAEWIPDFQHRHFPEFFSASDRAQRDRDAQLACAHSARIIVSSESARADLEAYFPSGAAKARVLRFVDSSAPTAAATPEDALRARYGLDGPWFALPNQFWAHKNHALVVEALRILRERGRRVVVLATGSTRDPRRPGHFDELMRATAAAGVGDAFRVLGIVPWPDLVAIVRGAVAVVNPSRFEGWSTSVEESKSLGKAVVLSDIAVHREQAPPRARYFPPSDAGALADALWDAWSAFDPAEEERSGRSAAAALPARRRAFADEYAAIVREVLGSGIG